MRNAGARHELDRIGSFPPARSAPTAVPDDAVELDATSQLRVERYALRHPGVDLADQRTKEARRSRLRRERDVVVHAAGGLAYEKPLVAAQAHSGVQLVPLKHDEFGEPNDGWDVQWPDDDDDDRAVISPRRDGPARDVAQRAGYEWSRFPGRADGGNTSGLQLARSVPRAAWTPRERRFDTADRTARAAALRLLPVANASSATVNGVEVFSGILRLSRIGERLRLRTLGVIEWNDDDLDFARQRFPGVLATADVLAREYRRWLALPEVMFVIACAPCRIVATPGRQLGVGDADAYVTTDATLDVADHFRSPFVVGENHANIALLRDGEVLKAMDARHARGGRDRSPIVSDAPLGVEMVLDTGLAEIRHRIALAYVDRRVLAMIGPSPRLRIKCATSQCIADILDDPLDVPPFLFVDGRLRCRHVTLPLSRERPTVAAVLTFGEQGGAVELGVRALRTDDSRRPIDARLCVVTELDADGTSARLFVDDEHLWLPGRWPVARLFVMEHNINVHDVRGVATATTDFGLPPVYEDKQLILVGGRARRFTTDELFRLGGDSPGLSDLRQLTTMSESAKRRHAGKSLSVNLGVAMMTRLRAQIDAFLDVRDGGTPEFDARAESKLASKCVRLVAATAVVVVFLRLVATGARVLVNVETSGFPGVARSGVEVTHRNVIDVVNPLLDAFTDATGLRPPALRADWSPSASHIHVVACPLDDDYWASNAHPQMSWLTLEEIRQLDQSLHDTAAVALACCTSLQAQR